jgi:hypothetical protein
LNFGFTTESTEDTEDGTEVVPGWNARKQK